MLLCVENCKLEKLFHFKIKPNINSQFYLKYMPILKKNLMQCK